MKIYLFQDADQVSNPDYCYHAGGSVMVVAETDGEVENLLKRFPNVQLSAEDWQKVRHFPTHNYIEPEVFIFPDAGCC
jgi:hypothetical protein